MKRFSYLSALLACLVAGLPSSAWAMHISEGILPAGWAALWYAAALPFLGLGILRIKRRATGDLSYKPLLGLMAAAVFIISCMPIPVPTAGTCSHPCGTAMSAILLGPLASVVVAAAALLIQALFLAHGGLTTLGGNIVSMGIAGSLAGFLVFRVLRRLGLGLAASAFTAGVLADWATYAVTSLELATALHGSDPVVPLFGKIVLAFVPTQLPLGIVEGFMTAGMVTLLKSRRPDILARFGIMEHKGVRA